MTGIGGGGPKISKSNNASNNKAPSEATIKNKTNNDTILTPNGDVITTSGVKIPRQFVTTILNMEFSNKKEWFNKGIALNLAKEPNNWDLSIGYGGVKYSTVEKLMQKGYFPHLKNKTKNEIIDYLNEHSYESVAEVLGTYTDLWKDYIDLKKPENFAVLAQFFNQGNDENPHKFPIIDYWGYGMKARTLLYEILNKYDKKGFSVSKYPPAPEDFIIVKFKKVDDKTEDWILPDYKEVPKTYPGKPDTYENFIKRINKKIDEIINSIKDFISLNQS